MKNKILFLAFSILSCTISVNAQSQSISFGLRAGVNAQNINGKDNADNDLKNSIIPGFNVGATIQIPVATDFYVQTGLLYSTKGAKYSQDLLGIKETIDYNLGYVELPINFLYKPLVGHGKMILGFGPYVAYGINGKVKYDINNLKQEEKIEYTSEYTSIVPTEDKYFKKLDYGANLLFGYELSNGLSAQFNAQLGLTQINSDNTVYPNNKISLKNTGFGVSLGYMF